MAIKRRVTIYLEPEVTELMFKAASVNDRSMTQQVEHIVKQWLVKNKYMAKK